MPWHTVQQGEFIDQLAQQFGLKDGQAIYNHPENAQLRQQRPDPNLLFPGDQVFIPEKEIKQVSASCDTKHKFLLLRPKPIRLNIVAKNPDDQPLSSKPYKLTLDGKVLQGNSTSAGLIEVDIPVTTKEGTLEIEGYKFPVRIGHLDPLDLMEGVKGRLNNLGYDCGPVDRTLNDETREAIRQFQRDNQIEVTGEADSATINKLRDKYGS